MLMKTKKCRGCGEAKPISEFHKKTAAKDGLQSRCKPCAIKMAAEWNQKNQKKYLARQNRRTPEQLHRRRARLYGLTPEELHAKLEEAQGICQICKREAPQVVDHCHTSGLVRGVICNKCNQALGLIEDNVEWLYSMAQYLQKYNNVTI